MDKSSLFPLCPEGCNTCCNDRFQENLTFIHYNFFVSDLVLCVTKKEENFKSFETGEPSQFFLDCLGKMRMFFSVRI